MTYKRYTEEFRVEAVRQVTERGYSVYEVAERLGVSTKSNYKWIEIKALPKRLKKIKLRLPA